MKVFLYTLLFSLYLCASASGSGFAVTGSVIDSANNQALSLATVTLLRADSDKIISGAIADTNGKFAIEAVTGGAYRLSVSVVGYLTRVIAVNIKSDTNIGSLKLYPNSKALGEAVVVAEKSLIVKTSEKTVFNVAQSPSNQVGTAEDVLRNMPGVMLDQKDNISITGKQGVIILVDGKPNALAQNDLATFLKSTPASSIEAIELITNPSAKYDAEGNAGIINIKLKKGKADGLNGSISAGYGILNRYAADAAINYQKSKFNVFANYSFNDSKVNNEWIENRKLLVNDSTSYYNFDSKGTQTSVNNSLKAGIDYHINETNSLTYTLSGNYSTINWLSDALSDNFNSLEAPVASYNSTDGEKNRNYSVMNDIAYQKNFDSSGRQLNIDVSYTYVNGFNTGNLNSLGYDSTGVYNPALGLLQSTYTTNTIQNAVLQLDYIHPFKRWPGYKFEAGVKNETTNNQNVFDVYQTLNNIETRDSLLSNSFNYTENIAAAYFIASGAYKKILTYSAGFRGEYTYIRSNDNSVNKNYFSPFPSASLSAALSETQNLSFSYSRRVQRPQFRQLNNNVSYVDQYTTWQGNPLLLPSFSHVVSADYSINVKRHMFSLEASGNFQTNGFIGSSYVDSNRITRGGEMNGADSKTFNLTFFSKLQLTNWWDFSMSHTYSYSYFGFKEGLNTAPIAGSQYNLWANTSIKVWKNMFVEVGGWFNSQGVQAQGIIRDIGGLHASVRKSFFKDRFTVSIAAQDILNTLAWSWTVNSPTLIDQGTWKLYDRMVMLTLTYKFGSNKPFSSHREKESNDRLGGGGPGR